MSVKKVKHSECFRGRYPKHIHKRHTYIKKSLVKNKKLTAKSSPSGHHLKAVKKQIVSFSAKGSRGKLKKKRVRVSVRNIEKVGKLKNIYKIKEEKRQQAVEKYFLLGRLEK